jgi:Holliday junction resolvase-like predicted endonuclease
MTNYAHGHEAEKVAAEWLRGQGYKIIALNWRDKRAEIDIVARRKHEPLRFIEVKYRETAGQGDGFDYITPSKLRQMAFAAELYAAKERFSGEYTLAALEVSGQEYAVSGFIAELM